MNYTVGSMDCVCEKSPEVQPSVVEAVTMLLYIVGRLETVSSRLLYRTVGQTTQEHPGPDRTGLLSDLGYLYRELNDVNDRLSRVAEYIG